MFINTEVIIDMETGEVIAREGFEYNGPVAQCGGGGGGGHKPKSPPPPPKPPKKPKASPAVKEAQKGQLDKKKKRAGLGAAILTGAGGMETKAPTTGKKLLSGTQ